MVKTSSPLIVSIDQGTTSSRTLALNDDFSIVSSSQEAFPQIFPHDGWVEHDPEAIWDSVLKTCNSVLCNNSIDIAGIGITNQRETSIIWDKATGNPVYNAIVWQDRRTADWCDELKKQGLETTIAGKTGLLLDPYFSASKIKWILDNVTGARSRANNGELAFGTVDSFLIWRLTNGKRHVTDATNASRTLLFNIHDGIWDPDLLEIFDIPAQILPAVNDCAYDFGTTSKNVVDHEIAIAGVAGDQQAALFGQACFQPGMIKSTYGTGCFMVMNTGDDPIKSDNRLLTTIGYQLNGRITYALEGSIFNAGTTIQWLRDGLKLIKGNEEIEPLVLPTTSNNGVYLVPAFTGLGAPQWAPNARGLLCGLTRDTEPANLFRAALESVCYQTNDLVDAMESDSGLEVSELRVDGGMTANSWMLQFLADITRSRICKPELLETTALGVAYLAALQCELIDSVETLSERWKVERDFTCDMDEVTRQRNIHGWSRAMERCLL